MGQNKALEPENYILKNSKSKHLEKCLPQKFLSIVNFLYIFQLKLF